MSKRKSRQTPTETVLQATVAFVVLLGAFIYFSITSQTTGPMSVLMRTLQPMAWVGFALFSAVLVFRWKQALRDQAATRAAFQTRKQLAELTPEQFERWCQTRLQEAGYRTVLTGGQSDHGVDLAVERDGQRIVVQCKRYAGRRTVGEPQLRDLYGAMHHQKADGAIAITAGTFTPAARSWARGKPIELWDLDHLARLPSSIAAISAVGTAAPPQVQRCPKCGSNLVARTNRATSEKFFGCSSFPKCRFTQHS